MQKKTGGYTVKAIDTRQLKKAIKEKINIKDNDIFKEYIKRGYSIDDRNKLFTNFIKNNKYKTDTNKLNLDKALYKINGGCNRSGYY